MNNVATIDRTEVPAPLTPMEMLDRAVSNGATPETLEKLLNLQERWESSQARKAYIAGMAKARSEFQPVLKKHSGYNDRYKFETLDDVIEAVGPALTKYGFNYDWITEDLAEGNVRVTCVITHEDGHQRTNSMSGDPRTVADAKANMNSVQRSGAVVTYLQRYTLKAALGVAASKDDDAKKVDDYDTSAWLEKLEACGTDMEKLKKFQAEMKSKRPEIPAGAWRALSSAFAAATQRATAGAAND